jgi:GT2 family glycosyltransferase
LRRAFFDVVYGGMPYSVWVEFYDTVSRAQIREMTNQIERLSVKPVFSLVVLVRPDDEFRLEALFQSLGRQFYESWDLWVVGQEGCCFLLDCPGTANPIHWIASDTNSIGSALNEVVKESRSDYLVILDRPVVLREHALFQLADAVNRTEKPVLLYADSDYLNPKGQRCSPVWLPGWSSDLLLEANIPNKFCALDVEVIQKVGAFRSRYGRLCVWDLVLRLDELFAARAFYHVPCILFHQASEESGFDDPMDVTFKRLILQDCSKRRFLKAEVVDRDRGDVRLCFRVQHPPPLVSIIVPTRNCLSLLRKCLTGLFEKTDYDALEIIVVDNRTDDAKTLAYLNGLALQGKIRLLRFDYAFNFAAINNFAVRESNGEIVCLLNNDVEPIEENWLQEMVAHASRNGIGAVGAMLYYPNDTIQHGGVYLNGTAGDHWYQGCEKGYRGPLGMGAVMQNFAAVTAACMVVRKKLWNDVGGMDEENFPIAFNDVDFCLRLQEKGYRNLWTPYAELYHFESVSRGKDDTPKKRARFESEVEALGVRWSTLLSSDSSVNPNQSFQKPWRRLACPPRVNHYR